MNNFVLIGGLALLALWGTSAVIIKLAIGEIGLQVMIWEQIVALILFPLYFVFFQELLPLKLSPPGIAWAVLASVLGLSGSVLLNVLMRSAPASVVIPISALYPVVSVILAYFFLHEDLSWTRVAGVACALVAIWLLSA